MTPPGRSTLETGSQRAEHQGADRENDCAFPWVPGLVQLGLYFFGMLQMRNQ